MTIRSILTLSMMFFLITVQVYSDGTIRKIRIPILMYHYVSPLPPDTDDIREGLTISPELFRSHIEFLKQEG